MRNPSFFLISVALSVQLSSAAPFPIGELAPVSGALKSAASALQGTTKGLSTGMAGGMGGVAGGMAGGMTAIPKIPKRQLGNKALDLSVAGVKPGDLMRVIKDPTSALEELPVPVEGLTKRVLGALGGLGLGGLLDGLMPKPKAAPPMAPPASPRPPQAKEKGTDSSVNIDNPQTSSEASADIPGLEEALDGTSAARNGTNSVATSKTTTQSEPEPENSPESQTFSSPNTNTNKNSRSGETPSEGADTQVVTNERLFKRVLENLMPNSKVNAEGLKNPELVLKELGAADVIKTVIDAPDLTGMKEKRTPLDPLSQLDSVTQAVKSAETLLKAVPLGSAV